MGGDRVKLLVSAGNVLRVSLAETSLTLNS
jgi:hypothetical protein